MAAPHKQPDQKRIVALLAEQAHMPIGEVATLYEHERDELSQSPHIANYLHIFAIRNVQEVLRKRSVDNRALMAEGAVLLAA